MLNACENKKRKRKGRIKLEERYANPRIVKNTQKEIEGYYEMTYDEMCNYLTNKYGKSIKPFYVTETFKTRNEKNLIPIEVKATDGATRTLTNMVKANKYKDIDKGIKLCKKNIEYDGKIYTFPYFLAFLLKKWVKNC